QTDLVIIRRLGLRSAPGRTALSWLSGHPLPMHVIRAGKRLTLGILCLLACVLAAAQVAPRNDWLLQPQLARGQQFNFSGWFAEEKLAQGVQCQPAYRLESHLLVLEAAPRKFNVAVLTALSLRDPRPDQKPAAQTPVSVHLELADVDGQGRIRPR